MYTEIKIKYFILVNICLVISLFSCSIISNGTFVFRHMIILAYSLLIILSLFRYNNWLIPTFLFYLPFDYSMQLLGFRFYPSQILIITSIFFLMINKKCKFNGVTLKANFNQYYIYFLLLLTFWIGFLCINILYTNEKYLCLMEIIKWISFISFMIIYAKKHGITNKSQINLMIDILIIGGFFQSLIAIDQQLELLPFRLYISELSTFVGTSNSLSPIYRGGGTIGNPSLLAFWMITPLILLVYKMIKSYKTIYILFVVFMLVAFIFTLSRMAWVAFIFGFGIIVLFRDKEYIFKRFIGYTKVIISTFFILLLTYKIFFIFKPSGLDPVELINTRVFQNLDTYSGRSAIWNEAIISIKKSPIIGNGVGSSSSIISGMKLHVHNTLLQFAFEAGIFGIVFFFLLHIGILFIILISKQKVYQFGPEIAFSALLLAYIIGGLTEYIFFSYQIGLLFFLNLSILISTLKTNSSKLI